MTDDPPEPESTEWMIAEAGDLLRATEFIAVAKDAPQQASEILASLFTWLRWQAALKRQMAQTLRRRPEMAERIADELDAAADRLDDMASGSDPS